MKGVMMISKNISYLKILFLIFVLGFVTSCVLSPTPFREVKYHDLGNPEAINEQGPFVEFSRWTLNGPYKTKMVFRGANNQLIINEYHKWAQTPDALLGRYLTLAFRGRPESDSVKRYIVKGSILAFEANQEKSQAVLMIEYSIVDPYQGKKKSFSRTLTAEMAEVRPESLAGAMSKIADNLAGQLKKDMLGMK